MKNDVRQKSMWCTKVDHVQLGHRSSSAQSGNQLKPGLFGSFSSPGHMDVTRPKEIHQFAYCRRRLLALTYKSSAAAALHAVNNRPEAGGARKLEQRGDMAANHLSKILSISQ